MSEKSFNPEKHFREDLSRVYDERIRQIIPGYEAMHEVAQHLLQEHISDRANILVAGVGTGHELKTYALNNSHWNIVGFDSSADMLAVARDKIKPFDLENRVTLIHGNIDHVNEEVLFDGASSILVMQFLDDNGTKQYYLEEIAKRLRHGARIVLIDLEGEKYSKEFNMLLSAWKSHQYSTRDNVKQVDRDFKHVDENLQFASEERIRQLLTGAGFSDICKFYKTLLFGGYIATKTGRNA